MHQQARCTYFVYEHHFLFGSFTLIQMSLMRPISRVKMVCKSSRTAIFHPVLSFGKHSFLLQKELLRIVDQKVEFQVLRLISRKILIIDNRSWWGMKIRCDQWFDMIPKLSHWYMSCWIIKSRGGGQLTAKVLEATKIVSFREQVQDWLRKITYFLKEMEVVKPSEPSVAFAATTLRTVMMFRSESVSVSTMSRRRRRRRMKQSTPFFPLITCANTQNLETSSKNTRWSNRLKTKQKK